MEGRAEMMVKMMVKMMMEMRMEMRMEMLMGVCGVLIGSVCLPGDAKRAVLAGTSVISFT